jgi:hypothetical protein
MMRGESRIGVSASFGIPVLLGSFLATKARFFNSGAPYFCRIADAQSSIG